MTDMMPDDMSFGMQGIAAPEGSLFADAAVRVNVQQSVTAFQDLMRQVPQIAEPSESGHGWADVAERFQSLADPARGRLLTAIGRGSDDPQLGYGYMRIEGVDGSFLGNALVLRIPESFFSNVLRCQCVRLAV